MINPRRFLLITALIFGLERLLPLTGLAISIFPLFLILFLLKSKNYPNDFNWLVGPTLAFDFFSGIQFGLFSLLILGAAGIIYLARQKLAVDQNRLISFFFFYFIFVMGYGVLFWLKLPRPQFLITVLETSAYTLPFYFLVLGLEKVYGRTH